MEELALSPPFHVDPSTCFIYLTWYKRQWGIEAEIKSILLLKKDDVVSTTCRTHSIEAVA
jgi:hypothetical protein